MKKQILLVDDDLSHLQMLKTILADWGNHVIDAPNGGEILKICEELANQPQLALLDMRMPHMNGLELMSRLKERWPGLPVVIMTAFSEVADAVEAMRQGAFDYIAKPVDLDKLKLVAANAIADAARPADDRQASGEKRQSLGRAPAILRIEELIDAVAPTEATVLITGASGTGKEVAARTIHARSGRRDGPFLGLNCGALSTQLMESELFGHEKGAFTGADKLKTGLFAEACGGTLFLDEIGEMPLAMQVKLLRVLQEREFMRVGGQKSIKLDCRIMAATNKDLASESAAGRFREDLFYRLNVFHVEMPPLKDRSVDIPWLALNFAEKFAKRNNKAFKGITKESMDMLMSYSWPGNIRELENVIERAVILMLGEYITPKLLPEMIIAVSAQHADAADFLEIGEEPLDNFSDSFLFADMTLQEMEMEMIKRTLRKYGNNKTEAARALGITRKTLHSKIINYTNKK